MWGGRPRPPKASTINRQGLDSLLPARFRFLSLKGSGVFDLGFWRARAPALHNPVRIHPQPVIVLRPLHQSPSHRILTHILDLLFQALIRPQYVIKGLLLRHRSGDLQKLVMRRPSRARARFEQAVPLPICLRLVGQDFGRVRGRLGEAQEWRTAAATEGPSVMVATS
jgi:hypothetical protein